MLLGKIDLIRQQHVPGWIPVIWSLINNYSAPLSGQSTAAGPLNANCMRIIHKITVRSIEDSLRIRFNKYSSVN